MIKKIILFFIFIILIFIPNIQTFWSWESYPSITRKKESIEREIKKTEKTLKYLETLEKKRSVIYEINKKKEYLKLLKDILYEKIKLEIIIYSILWLVWLFYLILIIKIIILLINW